MNKSGRLNQSYKKAHYVVYQIISKPSCPSLTLLCPTGLWGLAWCLHQL